MPWFDVDEAIYGVQAPEDVARAREIMRRGNTDFSGLETCNDLETARFLLAFSNRDENRNELIAIHSNALHSYKGETVFNGVLATWIGFDVVALGGGSLLSCGVFARADYFHEWTRVLNEHGLLPTAEACEAYGNDYRSAALQGLVEDLPDPTLGGIASVEIGKLAALEGSGGMVQPIEAR
jgi:hypothetical protein